MTQGGTMFKEFPGSFDDLSKKELLRSAEEDFALALADEEKSSKALVVAAFAEANLTWEDYVAQHPEVLPKEDAPENVIKTSDVVVEDVFDIVEPVGPVETTIRVAEAPEVRKDELWLVKMVRKNPLFQVRGHTFTQQNPYALMSANNPN